MSTAIRSEIAQISPLDELEEAHIDDALAWVDSGAPLCRVSKPATPPKHLVSYFAVVDGDHVLLVDHKNAQRWLPTGGHVEPGEHPRETVARELGEELGLHISVESVFPPLFVTVTETVGISSGHTDVSLWYVVRGNRSQTIEFDDGEFNSFRWFHFSEVPTDRADPHLERFIEKLRAKV